MGVRGYVFIKLENDVTPNNCLEIRRKLESMQEVINVDGVIDIDWFDMLTEVDTPILVRDVANKIEKIQGVASAQPARVVAPPEF
jgi:hypothetical protein